jgi:hypothetical protein
MKTSTQNRRDVQRAERFAAFDAEACKPVRLLETVGYVTDYDETFFKPEGSIITKPHIIKKLRERGVKMEPVDAD